TKSELFSAKIPTLISEKLRSGGQKGRGLGGRNFCPPSLFRRRISFFASQKAPQEKMLPLPQPTRARATTRNSLNIVYDNLEYNTMEYTI
ncbi:MAG: hypothetical protein WBC21_01515, partial [Minisyncoccales bacterium]